MNRLHSAGSPYLLQHRDNPVHWWEWSGEAFEEARRSNRPVLLSVGYAACHWCHVMAHESFEDEATAEVMNELFVCIKVDREERPDVDHVYMTALQLLGERGGWPLTMFLTPRGEPFWGGTYFPKHSGFGRPSFADVLREIARLFRAEPERIAMNRDLIDRGLRRSAPPDGGALDRAELDAIGAQACALIDPRHGGIKGAPKFPNPTILELLARHARRTGDAGARDLFLLTLERMALGGIHDHLGGGFARYSTDERWLVPHFEKMLYDNAQLLELFAIAAAETGRLVFLDAAEGIVAWLKREMVTPEGAFASSLDADSEGEEGRFYVWSLAEVREVLGSEAAFFEGAYDVTAQGNWERTNVLNRLCSGEAGPSEGERLAALRGRLLDRRANRVRPGLDDKILADWNGLTVAALVRAGLLLRHPDWIRLAERAYRFVRGTMTSDGRLGHSWRSGSPTVPGFALDYAAMMRAALALEEARPDGGYLEDAIRWRAVLLDEFRVVETGLLAMTAKSAEGLIVRPQPTNDDAVPNANGVFLESLVRLASATGAEDDRRLAEGGLAAVGGAVRGSPLGHASVLNALDLYLRGLTIFVTGDPGGALVDAALALPYLDRTVCIAQDLSALSEAHPARAAARAGTGPQALVCSGMSCSLPLSRPQDLRDKAAQMLRLAPR